MPLLVPQAPSPPLESEEPKCRRNGRGKSSVAGLCRKHRQRKPPKRAPRPQQSNKIDLEPAAAPPKEFPRRPARQQSNAINKEISKRRIV